ncbi:cyanophycinase [Stieleria mannarensis]|uniref:cyanophycinase n=1 Tax=Stieleria mannarensis TaxID=2755585 RepID=UPI0015FED57D|nr:cyanophycinase [Rhodopirellula sp. JC639]
MKNRFAFLLVVFVHGCFASDLAFAQEKTTTRKLVICGGGSLPDTVFDKFRELAEGMHPATEPQLVVIPTASQRKVDLKATQELWSARGFRDVQVLHTTDPDIASTDEFVQPLLTASAVWFDGGSQQRIANAYLDSRVDSELRQLLLRGGVIGGTSAGAAIQSRVMIAGGKNEPKISTGLGFLPEAIIDQHFLKRNRLARSLAALRQHPNLIGLGIDEGTALVVEGGATEVIGKSYVLRLEWGDEKLKLDAFGNGATVPLKSQHDSARRNHACS